MEFDNHNEQDDDYDEGFNDERDDVDDDEPDRDDISDSISSDFSRDSKQVLEDSFFEKRAFLPDTKYLDSKMDFDLESNNPLNDLNDIDPEAMGSAWWESSAFNSQVVDQEQIEFKIHNADSSPPLVTAREIKIENDQLEGTQVLVFHSSIKHDNSMTQSKENKRYVNPQLTNV